MLPAAALMLLAALLLPACVSAPQEDPPVPPAAEETLAAVAPPPWFTTPPGPTGSSRFVPGSGSSRDSVDDALRLAEENAHSQASRMAGALVRTEWKRHAVLVESEGTVRSGDRFDAITSVFSEEEITGAAVRQRTVRIGDRLRNDLPSGRYYRGFVLLEVPEENFLFSAARCLKKAHALFLRDEREEALTVLEGATLFWPGDAELLDGLAALQERAGRPGDAIASLNKLRGLVDETRKERIGEEIARLERACAGGEYAFQLARLGDALSAAVRKEKLALARLDAGARVGGTVVYTVRTDSAYTYYGLWIDDEGIFLYPAHGRDSGMRLGTERGAEAVALDVGHTPGAHLFALIAATERPGWFEERPFLKGDVDRRTADEEGRLPHRDLARIIDDLSRRARDGALVVDSFSFDVRR